METTTMLVTTADGAGVDRLKSWEISIDNKLTDGRFFGSATIDEPLADDYAETTIKWTMEFKTTAAISAYLANTQMTPMLRFSQVATSNYIKFEMANGYIVTPIGRTISRWGILTQEFTIEAADDAATPSTGLTVTVANTDSTIS